MVFEHIEKLKSEYTDKYVIVNGERPELRRFRGMTGTVRTVNMSGRALVEFDAYNNIAWYDIDVDYLKVIDEPLPKEEPEKKPAAKPAKKAPAAKPAEKKVASAPAPGGGVADILAAARAEKSGDKPKPAAAPAPATTDPSKMSVADMMAAARAEKSGAAAPVAKAPAAADDDAKKSEVSKILEAARRPKSPAAVAPEAETAPAKPAGKLDPTKMSVQDMLAAARGEKSGGAPPAAPAAAQPAAEQPAAEQPAAVEEPVPEAPVEETPVEESAPEPAAAAGPVPTETPDIIEYCRRVDAS